MSDIETLPTNAEMTDRRIKQIADDIRFIRLALEQIIGFGAEVEPEEADETQQEQKP